jgi:geranylgeranyl diphosphate synthase type II
MLSIKQLAGLYAARFSEINFEQEPQSLYGPMKHSISSPGKHIRPILLLLSSEAFGGQMEDAVNAAHAIELFHTFTLVHDDIMDAATLRRGTPTVHKHYGLNSGVLAGDALCIYAYKYLCAVDPRYLLPVLQVFNDSTIEIMEGQQMDMDFEQRLDVSIDEYLKMIGYKTSVLLACSLRIGSIIGGASAEDQQRIYDFGMKMGLSFQIMDDWLDTFGESNKVGKKVGGDIIQNKKTYLLITLLKDVDGVDRKTLLSLFDEKDEDKKVAGIRALYDKYDISKKTMDKVNELYNESLADLGKVHIADDRKVNLLSMAESIRKRDF